jgi:hypothetical protein
MSTINSTRPVATTQAATESLENVIAGTARRGRVPADLTAALLRYWHELPRHDVAARERLLASIRARVRSGELAERAFAVFVLGDGDASIVGAATAEYVGAHPVSVEWRQAAIADAIDWIRRALPLSRGAVFGALLALHDPAVNESLAGLRLVLGHGEIATACRFASARPAAATREFLAGWLQLLEAGAERDAEAERLVRRALEA